MRAWKGCRKSRLLSRKQTVSDRRFRMRRACALGRNPSGRWVFRTGALVSRLTCELEFSTREIVPTPTPAARATSRMVVFCGTASIESGPSTFGHCRSKTCGRGASLAHSLKTGAGTSAFFRARAGQICSCPGPQAPYGAPVLIQKHDDRYHFFEIPLLTCRFCSVSLWNQFHYSVGPKCSQPSFSK